MKEEGKICYEAPAITVTEGGICLLSGNGS